MPIISTAPTCSQKAHGHALRAATVFAAMASCVVSRSGIPFLESRHPLRNLHYSAPVAQWVAGNERRISCAHCAFSAMTKLLRPSAIGSQRASPPWRRAICRTRARPRPVPVLSRLPLRPSATIEGREDPWSLSAGCGPGPPSHTFSTPSGAFARDPHLRRRRAVTAAFSSRLRSSRRSRAESPRIRAARPPGEPRRSARILPRRAPAGRSSSPGSRCLTASRRLASRISSIKWSSSAISCSRPA